MALHWLNLHYANIRFDTPNSSKYIKIIYQNLAHVVGSVVSCLLELPAKSKDEMALRT